MSLGDVVVVVLFVIMGSVGFALVVLGCCMLDQLQRQSEARAKWWRERAEELERKWPKA